MTDKVDDGGPADVPRLPSQYDAGFKAGYGGEEPHDSYGRLWGRGWYAGHNEWKRQEAEQKEEPE